MEGGVARAHLQCTLARCERFRFDYTLQKFFQLQSAAGYKVWGGAKYCFGRNVFDGVLGTVADELRDSDTLEAHQSHVT